MDDFIIPTKTIKELEEQMIRFLKIAEKHNLYFKRSKCDFNMEGIPILGVIVGKGKVWIEQEKVKAVKEWKTLIRIKEMESFLGFANFYWRFIQNFSHTAKPFNDLKGKKELKWEEDYQRAFKDVKDKITSQLVLFLLKRKEKFRVETDISGYTIREVLSQEQKDK